MLSAEGQVTELERENALLREALREQWEFNHAEHCSNEWPHAEGRECHWPLPLELEGYR
jgi:hypothetical protein